MQSRYYDPNTGRFINADAFPSTGQGLIGNNMFVYCLNNPVMGCDYTGERAISLWDARVLHNEVARRVAREVNGIEGVYVKKVDEEGKTVRGFLDVYDPKTNSYYEIKSVLSAQSSRTQKQMRKYDNSEPVFESKGPITRGTEYISGKFSHGIFDVTYRTESAGLVSYTVDINAERAVSSVISALIIVGLSMVTGPSGAIGFAFA